MNAKFLEHVKAGAVQVVAQKIADGAIDPATASFEDLVKEFEEKVLALAVTFGAKNEEIPAPVKARKPRKEKNERNPSASLTPEAVKGFLVGGEKATLQAIADHFSVSKGVAERALKALEGVQSEPGTPEPGKRGKPATVYFLP